MVISEAFQVIVIIVKLSLSWKESKNYFKYKSNKIGIEYLILKLKVKKDNKLSEKRIKYSSINPKANLVEQVVKIHNKDQEAKLVERRNNIAKLMENALYATR